MLSDHQIIAVPSEIWVAESNSDDKILPEVRKKQFLCIHSEKMTKNTGKYS